MPDKFKILVADKIAPEGLDFIKLQTDAQLVNKPGLTEDELAAIAGQYDAIIVRSGVQVTAKVLANPGQLKVVARAGVGVDNIDLAAATSAGILVVNSAEASTITTAEHAFTLLMALARNVGPAYKTMTEGGWDRSKYQGRQLAGMTLGVVGFGRIGCTVAQRALAFNMNVMAYDPFFNAPTALDGKVKMFKQFADLLPHVDAMTFHVPLNDQTRGLLGDKTFPQCRDGVLVVNASRGGVVDEAALVTALDSGKCGGAALDVFTTEPPPADHPLRKHPKVLLTPHLGASTVEAQQAVSIGAASAVFSYLRGQSVEGAVNVVGLRFDLDTLQLHYVDLAQRMAKLISPLLTHGISGVTLELNGAILTPALTTIERIGLIGLLQPHLDVPLNMVNVRHIAEQRGIRIKCVSDENAPPQIAINIDSCDPNATKHRIVGRVYDDMRPRVVEISGYHMDMIPAGTMVLIRNEDRPGMIGLVGAEFGQAKVNIADMAISRRDKTALMVLKVDDQPPESLVNRMQHRPGILKVAVVNLPDEK